MGCSLVGREGLKGGSCCDVCYVLLLGIAEKGASITTEWELARMCLSLPLLLQRFWLGESPEQQVDSWYTLNYFTSTHLQYSLRWPLCTWVSAFQELPNRCVMSIHFSCWANLLYSYASVHLSVISIYISSIHLLWSVHLLIIYLLSIQTLIIYLYLSSCITYLPSLYLFIYHLSIIYIIYAFINLSSNKHLSV